MMNIRFLTLADTEVDDAVFWYQKQGEDQSRNFLLELDRAVRLSFASKVENHSWIGSVQGAVATWSAISMRYS